MTRTLTPTITRAMTPAVTAATATTVACRWPTWSGPSGVGWTYSVLTVFGLPGEHFFEAIALLTAFVLFGHWMEMSARAGASDAVRALLDLAPPMAVVIRDGVPLEVPTSEVHVGELLLVRPGSRVPVDAVVEEGESS